MSEYSPTVYTVTQITEEISQVFNDSFGSVSVEGEISGWKVAGSGHAYFSLKDDKSLLKAVMWRSRLERLLLNPADGQLVRASGRVTVYAPRGDYQLDVTTLAQAGVGLLLQRFEKLKARLAEEGLFDSARKHPPPFQVRRVIVITSPTGAALQDFLRVLKSLATPVEILILPVRVQGIEAPSEIADAIARAGAIGADLVVLTRGGGSLEDLWGFNEEIVARAIAACPIPLISAVGHEVDFTISDFVADLRVPTPTAAAHLVADLVEGLFDNFADKRDRLAAALKDRIVTHRVELNLIRQRLKSENPISFLPHYRQRIDEHLERSGRALSLQTRFLRRDLEGLCSRMNSEMEKKLFRWRAGLLSLEERARAYDPWATLGRGYARIETARTHRPIRSRSEVIGDEDIRVQLSDGNFEATPHV